MRYDHVLFNSMLKILQHGVEKLKERGNFVMAGEVERIYQFGVNDFSLHHNNLAWALKYICTEQGILPPYGPNELNADEKAAARAEDLKATSTKDGRKAVKIAHARLVDAERMRPVTDAKKVVDEAEALKAEKKRLADEAQAERDRPGKELKAAEQAKKQAEAELRKAEEAISK